MSVLPVRVTATSTPVSSVFVPYDAAAGGVGDGVGGGEEVHRRADGRGDDRRAPRGRVRRAGAGAGGEETTGFEALDPDTTTGGAHSPTSLPGARRGAAGWGHPLV